MLLGRAMRNEIAAEVHFVRAPMLSGLDQGRTDAGPSVALMRAAKELEQGFEAFLNVSINAGFPWCDFEFTGPTAVLTLDASRTAPQRKPGSNLLEAVPLREQIQTSLKKLLREGWWLPRAPQTHVVNRFYTVVEAAARAKELEGGATAPLVIGDFSDNPGAGSYGDATNLLRALLEAGCANAAFGCVRDAEAAAAAGAAGAGAVLPSLALGGKTDARFGGAPLPLRNVEVLSVGDGSFVHSGPMFTGMAATIGACAVLRVRSSSLGGLAAAVDGAEDAGCVDVLVASENVQVLDKAIMMDNGLPELGSYSTIVVKSMQHFRGAFEPIAAEVLVADSGALSRSESYSSCWCCCYWCACCCCSCCLPSRALSSCLTLPTFPFENVRRPCYPIDADAEWNVSED